MNPEASTEQVRENSDKKPQLHPSVLTPTMVVAVWGGRRGVVGGQPLSQRQKREVSGSQTRFATWNACFLVLLEIVLYWFRGPASHRNR